MLRRRTEFSLARAYASLAVLITESGSPSVIISSGSLRGPASVDRVICDYTTELIGVEDSGWSGRRWHIGFSHLGSLVLNLR